MAAAATASEARRFHPLPGHRRKTGERIAFYRFSAKDLCATSFGFAPRWVTLQRTHPQKLQPGKPLPTILISVAFGKESEAMDAARFPWPPPPTLLPLRSDLKGYELRAHIFQGRGLPAKDTDGLLDPYVIVSVAGVQALGKALQPRSEIARDTHDPLWYETLRLQTWLPPLELAPEVVLQVWSDSTRLDAQPSEPRPRHAPPALTWPRAKPRLQVWSARAQGDGTADHFVGEYRRALRSVEIILRKESEEPKDFYEEPKWQKLGNIGVQEGGGELLVGFELFPIELQPDAPKQRMVSRGIQPVKSLTTNLAKVTSFCGSAGGSAGDTSKAALTPAPAPSALTVQQTAGAGVFETANAPPAERLPALQHAPDPELTRALVAEAASQPLPYRPVREAASVPDTGGGVDLPPAKLPPLQPSTEVLASIEPERKPYRLVFCVMGLRGLQPAGLKDLAAATLSPAAPFVEVDVGSDFGQGYEKTAQTLPSSLPSPTNPSYAEANPILRLELQLPTKPLYLPTINVRVFDFLFGGTTRPLLCAGAIPLTDRLPAPRVEPTAGEMAISPPAEPERRVVVVWENQRKDTRFGWSTRGLLPTDPPQFSSEEGPPYRVAQKDDSLPSQEWEWAGRWALDYTVNPDPLEHDGWAYAADFTLCGGVKGLDNQGSFDSIRRRKWMRTMFKWPARSGIEVAKRDATCRTVASLFATTLPFKPPDEKVHSWQQAVIESACEACDLRATWPRGTRWLVVGDEPPKKAVVQQKFSKTEDGTKSIAAHGGTIRSTAKLLEAYLLQTSDEVGEPEELRSVKLEAALRELLEDGRELRLSVRGRDPNPRPLACRGLAHARLEPGSASLTGGRTHPTLAGARARGRAE